MSSPPKRRRLDNRAEASQIPEDEAETSQPGTEEAAEPTQTNESESGWPDEGVDTSGWGQSDDDELESDQLDEDEPESDQLDEGDTTEQDLDGLEGEGAEIPWGSSQPPPIDLFNQAELTSANQLDNWTDSSANPPPKTPITPLPETTYYSTTATVEVGDRWRYHVVTDNEIFRISTVDDDFFGVDIDSWTEEMKAKYKLYKRIDDFAESTQRLCNQLKAEEVDHNLLLFRLQEQVFLCAMWAAAERVIFMERWPSAFEHKDGSHESHWTRAEYLVTFARTAQMAAQPHFELAFPNTPLVPWLTRTWYARDWLGPRIYALSPDNYEYFRQRRTAGKKQKIQWVQDQSSSTWDFTVERYPSVIKPWLPPLREGLARPTYASESDKSSHSMSLSSLDRIGVGL